MKFLKTSIYICFILPSICFGNLWDGKIVTNPIQDFLDNDGYVDKSISLKKDRFFIVKIDLNKDGYDDLLMTPKNTGYGHGEYHWTVYLGRKNGWVAAKEKEQNGRLIQPATVSFSLLCWIEEKENMIKLISWSRGGHYDGSFHTMYIIDNILYDEMLYRIDYKNNKLASEKIWKNITSKPKLTYKEYSYKELLNLSCEWVMPSSLKSNANLLSSFSDVKKIHIEKIKQTTVSTNPPEKKIVKDDEKEKSLKMLFVSFFFLILIILAVHQIKICRKTD